MIVKIKSRYLPTGHYLRPHDMEFCLRTTDFDEDQIFEWFKRFRNDCPNGKLTRAQLRLMRIKLVDPALNLTCFFRDMVRQLYPEGNAQIFVGEHFLFHFHFEENFSNFRPHHESLRHGRE